MDDDVRDFGRLFEQFLTTIVHQAGGEDGERLVQRLHDHLGVDPSSLPVVVDTFATYEHPNLQAGIDAWLASDGRSYELIGVAGSSRMHQSFTEILEMSRRHGAFGIGPVDYARLPISVTEQRDCVQFGIYLVADGPSRMAVLLRGPVPHSEQVLALEVLATSTAASDALFVELPALMAEHNVFRGKVISLELDRFGPSVGPIRFHDRPDVQRADVILADGALELIERQVIGIGAHRDKLQAAGQHLKRGVLLYGPPGTGKTHTARYLATRLADYTVVLLSGGGLGMVGAACSLARVLQPALVLLEDCDLVAMDRSYGPSANPLLFEVLDQMDGLAADADVAFVLTSNRADLLEPALAQRPGRIDVAVEIELPDTAARTALFALYGSGLHVDESVRARVVERTAGVTASFLKELVRRAFLIAAEQERTEPTPDDVDTALDEMLDAASRLNRALVGAGHHGGSSYIGPDYPEDYLGVQVRAAEAVAVYEVRPGIAP